MVRKSTVVPLTIGWMWIAIASLFWLLAGVAVAQDLELPAIAAPAPPVKAADRPVAGEPTPAVNPMPRPQRPAPTFERAQEPGETRVYRLKYADAASIAESLRGIIHLGGPGPFSVGLDKRTNSLVVLAPAATHKSVAEVIKDLDVPRSADEAAQIKVFTLCYANPLSAANTLSTLLTPEGARIAIDQRANSLIVRGPAETLRVAEALLERLDTRTDKDLAAAAPPATFQVRVVWLANGVSDDEAPGPADDLESVVSELAKVGIKDVRQIGQVMVNTTAEGRFQAYGSPSLGKIATDWQVQGELADRQGRAVLEIRLSAKGAAGESKVRAELGTTVSAPYGHYVVLGVTPIENMNSVFVVQVVPSE